MRRTWSAALIVGGLLTLSMAGSATWTYSDGFFSAGLSSSAWHWLEEDHHYARFQFHRIQTELSTLVLDVFVLVPVSPGTPPPSTQAARIRLRPTGGDWTNHQVVLHLSRNSSLYWAYAGQLVVSRRALQVGTSLEVRLERAHWDQVLGVTAHSVRLLSPTVESWSVGRTAQAPGPSTAHDTLPEGVVLGAGGPLTPNNNSGTVVRTGELGTAGWPTAERLRYGVPLSAGERIWLEVTFTGGSGSLALVAPNGRVVARVQGAGTLDLSYRAHVGGQWQVLLVRQTGVGVRYRLRIETAG